MASEAQNTEDYTTPPAPRADAPCRPLAANHSAQLSGAGLGYLPITIDQTGGAGVDRWWSKSLFCGTRAVAN